MRIQTHQQGHYTTSPNFSEKKNKNRPPLTTSQGKRPGKETPMRFFPLKDNTIFLGAKVAGIFRMMLSMGKLPEIHV